MRVKETRNAFTNTEKNKYVVALFHVYAECCSVENQILPQMY